MVLTDEEIKRFKGMAQYWKEVRARDDQNPLAQEAAMVQRILGVRILALVEDYIRLQDEKEAVLVMLHKANDALKGES